MNLTEKEIALSKISFNQALSHLVMNSSFTPNIGLYHGKIGLVVFFSIYAKYSQNKSYDKFAYDLLDDIYENINEEDISSNFENGLCGIGWAIEYLVQNGYMEGETDNILEDIDKRIMEYDVYQIPDLSLRKGLAGIAYYVSTRLSTFRKKDSLPFNPVFLKNLKEALLNAQFSDADEVPSDLLNNYINTLNGIKQKKIEFPLFLQSLNAIIPENLQSIPLGLEDGLAGILLNLIINHIQIPKIEPIFNQEKKQVIVFNEDSRAANYGVGTYIKLLVDALKDKPYEITIIHLHSHNTNAISIEKEDNITQIYITNIKTFGYNYNWKKQNEQYYRNVILLLDPYLNDYKKYIFQLNFMEMRELAIALKARFPYSQILITVHYTTWCFILSGDKNKLLKILDHPENKENKKLIKSIESEKTLLNICDKVIVIAKHSYNNLIHVYKIPKHKLILVPHGLRDFNSHLTKSDKKSLRQKYGFKEKELLLVFAGRLDIDKGIDIVAESFIELRKLYPQLRLIIAGDGNYNAILPKLTLGWSKVVFTGFVDKTILYELFSISNIGVLPSFHEEFGYVALEMMMMGLPLVVGKTSGLSELVVNGVSGITVTLHKEKKEENRFVLQTAIKKLLDNPMLCKQYAKNGRLHFLQNYNFEKFAQQTIACFE